eukprot:9242397-Ditylum_brightwellii.AAC.1
MEGEIEGWTNVIDKVLTSTLQVLTLANLPLAITYLLHFAIADLFLIGVEQGENKQESTWELV